MMASSSSQDIASSKLALSVSQLVTVSHIIHIQDIDKVSRTLGLTSKELSAVRHILQQFAGLVPASEETLRMLETWKEKNPQTCTLKSLEKALKKLKLNNTAEQVREAVVNGLKLEKKLLEEDANCSNQLVIDERMVNEVVKVLKSEVWTSLGSLLGLTREHKDNIAAKCKNKDITAGVYEMLMNWIQYKGSDATLGKLYLALKLMDHNATANNVFDICQNPAEDMDLK